MTNTTNNTPASGTITSVLTVSGSILYSVTLWEYDPLDNVDIVRTACTHSRSEYMDLLAKLEHDGARFSAESVIHDDNGQFIGCEYENVNHDYTAILTDTDKWTSYDKYTLCY